MALPPGITPKTVTVGIASFFDGSLAEGTATITAPVNVVHTPTNRPIFSSQISKRFVDGEASFDLCPTDAEGLNRKDWTFKLNVVIQGALVQPDPIYFTLPAAGPDVIDLDALVPVPSSAGIPVSVAVLTAEDLDGYAAQYIGDTDSATRAALDALDLAGDPITPEAVEANLPARLSEVELRAASGTQAADPTSPLRTELGKVYASAVAGVRWQSAPPPPRVKRMISAFQAGHGWTKTGGGGTVSDDTTAWALGSQSLKVATDGTQTDTNIRNTVGPVYDLTDANLLLWVKISDVTRLKSLMVRYGNSTFANRWASQIGWVSQPYYLSGEWQLVTLSLAGAVVDLGTPARNDIALFQISVSDNGQPVTVNIGGFAITPIAPDYRQGVVSLTFDDNYASDFDVARPAMDKYGFGGTSYAIAQILGTAGRGTLDQLHQLERNNGWEVAGHAYSVANHNAGYPSLSASALTAELSNLKAWLLDNGFRGANEFAYPGGQITTAVDAEVRRFFESGRTILGNFQETAPPGRLSRLRSYAASPSTTVASFTSRIDQAYAEGSWLVLTFHELVAGTPTGTQFRASDFQTVMDYLNTKGILVKTVGDVLRSLR